MDQKFINSIQVINASPYKIAVAKCTFDYFTNVVYAFGIDINKNVAIHKCKSEAEERYRTTKVPKNKMIQSAGKNLSYFVDPNKLYAYPNNSQDVRKIYGYDFFTSQKKWYWSIGKDLKNKKNIYLPTDFLYVGISNNSEMKKIDIPLAGRSNSSGCALHRNPYQTRASALLELIERDHVLAWWFLGLQSEKILFDVCNDKEIQEFISSCEKRNIRYTILKITLDFVVPVFITILEKDEKPFTTFGFGCDLIPLEGLKKSCREAFFIHTLLKRKMFQINPVRVKKKIHSLSDHGMYFASKNRRRNYCSVVNNSKPISMQGVESIKKLSYRHLFNSLISKGDLYEYEYYKSKRLTVLRMISDYLIPLSSSYQLRSIRKERMNDIIKSFPQKKLFTVGNSNLLPHPIF